MSTLERIDPYVEQLLDNEALRDNLSRAGRNLRAAGVRAGGRKNAKQAATDKQVRARALTGVRSAATAIVALRQGREQQARQRRRRRVLLMLAGAALAVAASRPEVRGRVSALAGAEPTTAGGTS
jgi:hypothetical protein